VFLVHNFKNDLLVLNTSITVKNDIYLPVTVYFKSTNCYFLPQNNCYIKFLKPNEAFKYSYSKELFKGKLSVAISMRCEGYDKVCILSLEKYFLVGNLNLDVSEIVKMGRCIIKQVAS